MYFSDQLVSFENLWDSVPVPGKLKPWTPNEISINRFAATTLALNFLPQYFPAPYSESVQIDDSVTYFRQPNDELIVQNSLDSLNQLFACQPGEVIEAFADYLSNRDVDWLRNTPRQEPLSSNAVSYIPRDRQVCIEVAAKDHVLHLETMILAKEQEAPTATALGQILISGWELWMRWKKKLLHSLSGCSRHRCTVGSQIALANAVQASFY
jgi:hypothetical protein